MATPKAKEWDGGDEGEEVSSPPPTAPVRGKTAKAGSDKESNDSKPNPIQTMPPHDENVHTQTPTPADTHQDGVEQLPAHKLQIAQEEGGDEFDLPAVLPPNTADAYKLLAKISTTPAQSQAAGRKRAAAVEKLKAHIYTVQQGLPLVEMTAHEYGKHVAKHRDILKVERIMNLARLHPELNELLEDYQDVLDRWNAVPPGVKATVLAEIEKSKSVKK